MRKIPAIFFLGALAASARAPSGGRGLTPPPLPPPPVLSEPPIQPERSSAAPAELRALPESVRTHQIKSLDKGSFSLSDFGGKGLVGKLWASGRRPAAG